MKLVIASDTHGKVLKEQIKAFLTERQYQVIDVSAEDIFDATMNVVGQIKSKEAHRGIVVDAYGVAPFMIANKNHGIICAPIYEHYTADMTRRHNSTQIVAVGAAVTAGELACQLAATFVNTEYDGGRHQVRVDMLDRML